MEAYVTYLKNTNNSFFVITNIQQLESVAHRSFNCDVADMFYSMGVNENLTVILQKVTLSTTDFDNLVFLKNTVTDYNDTDLVTFMTNLFESAAEGDILYEVDLTADLDMVLDELNI